MRATTWIVPLPLVFVGCAASGDDLPPILELTAPDRGTMSEAQTVTVTGIATDESDGLVVTVNGVDATLAADGSWSVTTGLDPGISIIETLAIDRGGNQVRDVRAILAGALVPIDTPVGDGAGAYIGRDALAAVGRGIATAVEAIDYTSAVQAANPVFQDGGCLGATVNVTRVDIASVDINLIPRAGAIDTEVILHGLDVDLDVDYEVACIGGGAGANIYADQTRIAGGLGVTVQGGRLVTSLDGVSVGFTGFDLDVGSIPGAVVDLFEGQVTSRLASALAGIIRDRVPPLADTQLRNLTGRSYSTSLLGRSIGISASPTTIGIATGGAFVAVDSMFTVDGGEDARYLATPSALTADMIASPNLGVAISDDAINQLFAGMWASKGLELDMMLDANNPVTALLDNDARKLEVRLSLPPTVSSGGDDVGGALGVAIGDLIVTARDDAGTELQQLAISIMTGLAATTTDGAIVLSLAEPQVYGQVLFQSDRVDSPLTGEELEGLIESVWGLVGTKASSALSALPMPTISGITIAAPSLESTGGYAVVEAALE
jgi:hypothetical protein